jgi:hypothetical protein
MDTGRASLLVGVSIGKVALYVFEPLTLHREYESILPLFLSTENPKSSVVSSRTRRDFARDLYDDCVRYDQTAGREFASRKATWFLVLRAAVRHTGVKAMSKENWIGALTVAMLSCRIECMPGSYQRKLSYRRAVQLVGSATPALSVAARPGSLKHAAIEAEYNAKRPSLRKSAIDFGCAIPFDAIPQLVEDGFRQQENQFRKGNQGILEHYQTARQCLAESLGDPLCDLMLMLVLTLASSSVTPTIAPAAHAFSPGSKKNSAMFAANLVTRMLWFLKPECFPWGADNGVILRVAEMTKKTGTLFLPKGQDY